MENKSSLRHTILPGAFFLLLLATSCTYKSQPQTGGLPPGQAKKVNGSQSAKPYAPGQQKKQNQ